MEESIFKEHKALKKDATEYVNFFWIVYAFMSWDTALSQISLDSSFIFGCNCLLFDVVRHTNELYLK